MPTADDKLLTIYNYAARMLGIKKLTSTTDGSPAQLVFTDMFATARDAFLVEHPWTFAQRRYSLVNISEPSETPDDWVTSTAYVLGDLVVQGGVNYACIVAHTSGTFATDLTNEKWQRCATSDEMVFTDDGMSVVYAEPSNLLKINFINDPNITFARESMLINSTAVKVILADSNNLKIKYTFQNDDLRTYFASALTALAGQLAMISCYNLVESRTVRSDIRDEYEKILLPRAISSDSQQGTPNEARSDEWESGRLVGGLVGRAGAQTWHPVWA